jgi:hypothetical protein
MIGNAAERPVCVVRVLDAGCSMGCVDLPACAAKGESLTARFGTSDTDYLHRS